jgi:hypothetical protein
MEESRLKTDSSGKHFVETEVSAGFRIRLTLVPFNESGWERESVRIQVVESKGSLRQGPEIPIDILGSVGYALNDLLSSSRT